MASTPDTALLAADSAQPAAVCQRHPQRRASITCPHCGSYACGACTVDTLWGEVMCEDCRRHGRAQYPLPWELSISPISFLQTAYLLFAETRPCFSDLPRGSVLRAVGFAATVALTLTLSSLLGEWLFATRHWASEVPSLPQLMLRVLLLHLPSTVLFVGVVAGVFHGVATLLGGETAFVTSLRAACYLSVIQLLELAVQLVDALLIGGTPVALIVRLVGTFFLVWGLSLVAEHRFKLSRTRAVVAGLAPALVLIGVAAAVLLVIA